MPDGSVRYTDRPEQAGAVSGGPVQIAPAQTYAAPPVRPAGAAARTLEPVARPAPVRAPFAGYEVFDIIAPVDGETVRANNGVITVSTGLAPALADGHEMEFLLDGRPLGRGTSTERLLDNLDRGAHTVTARVLDADGTEVARASPVAFVVRRTSRCERRRKDFAGCGRRSPCNCGALVAVPQ